MRNDEKGGFHYQLATWLLPRVVLAQSDPTQNLNIRLGLDQDIIGCNQSESSFAGEDSTSWITKRYISGHQLDLQTYRILQQHEVIGEYDIDYEFFHQVLIRKEYHIDGRLNQHAIYNQLKEFYGEPVYQNDSLFQSKKETMEGIDFGGHKKESFPETSILYTFEDEDEDERVHVIEKGWYTTRLDRVRASADY